MLEILVIGSIFSTQPIDTSGIHRAQATWAQVDPPRVAFRAPPWLGQSWHGGRRPRVQGLHNQGPGGMLRIP